MNQKSQDWIFHKYYFFFNISNWSVNQICLKEIFPSYSCIFTCEKYSQPKRKSSKNYFFKFVIYDKIYTFLMFFRKFDFRIVEIYLNFLKMNQNSEDWFFSKYFFSYIFLSGLSTKPGSIYFFRLFWTFLDRKQG